MDGIPYWILLNSLVILSEILLAKGHKLVKKAITLRSVFEACQYLKIYKSIACAFYQQCFKQKMKLLLHRRGIVF